MNKVYGKTLQYFHSLIPGSTGPLQPLYLLSDPADPGSVLPVGPAVVEGVQGEAEVPAGQRGGDQVLRRRLRQPGQSSRVKLVTRQRNIFLSLRYSSKIV